MVVPAKYSDGFRGVIFIALSMFQWVGVITEHVGLNDKLCEECV